MTAERCRVLGVDPGSRKCGWGVVDVVPARGAWRVVHVDNGVLMLDDDPDLTVRLVDLSHRLKDVVTAFSPTTSAVEDVFVHKGARSALILGQARGAVLATLGLCGLTVRGISTSQVKLRVTGRGRADKAQVAEMVRALLELQEVPFEDAADALAVAIAASLDRETSGPALRTQAPLPAVRRGGARASLLALAKAQGKA